MEEKNNNPLKAAITIGTWTFAGFSALYIFAPFLSGIQSLDDLRTFALSFIFILAHFLLFGPALAGLAEAFLFAATAYLIFRFLIPSNISQSRLKIIIVISSLVCAIIGFASFFPVNDRLGIHLQNDTVRKYDEIRDTNNDGKPDIWITIYKANNSKGIDKDTNFDGKVDISEWHKSNGEIEKSIDADFDGKKQINEVYFEGKLIRRRTTSNDGEIKNQVDEKYRHGNLISRRSITVDAKGREKIETYP